MIEIIKKPEQTLDEVRAVILDNCDSLEEEIEILDTDLSLDEATSVDFLMRDGDGKPAIVLLAEESDEETVLVHRILQIVQKLRKNRFLLEKIYTDPMVSFEGTPRIFLLKKQISNEFVECLGLMKGLDITACEYSYLRLEDRNYFTLSRKGEDEPVRAVRLKGAGEKALPRPDKAPEKEPDVKAVDRVLKEEEPAPVRVEKEKKEENQGARFFADARKKILKISVDINETTDGNLTRFKINNEPLASLALKDDFCYIFLGSKTDKAIKVATERLLNEALNQVYKRYFNLFNNKTAQELSGI